MAKTRGDLLATDKNKLAGKQQLYALLIDEEGSAILDVDGDEQIVELESVNGRLKTDSSITGNLVKQIDFQMNSTVVGSGTSLTVEGFKNLTVGIASSIENTARNIEFHGIDAVGNDNLISGVDKNSMLIASSTSNTGGTWQFDITGLATVYMNLTGITLGNVTIIGLAVV